ncbi:endonuclease, partial [Myxococcota bacterium]|nr:endonuclease [Myxococcota bacterium]
HIWPKTHGGFIYDFYPAYSDIHHMRPAQNLMNEIRAALDFDEGGELIEGSECRLAPDLSFEPRDAVKGDVARALFYMAVRYNGDEYPIVDLELVEEIPSRPEFISEETPAIGKLSTLLKWHAQDPPDAAERLRNDIIFEDYQLNRNPFIDYPEWVGEIW